MLTAAREAERTGRAPSRISHARRDPGHPANGPQARTVGRSVLVPTELVDAYWAGRRRRSGPDPALPQARAGLTLPQWRALAALAEGRQVGVGMRRRLRGMGLVDADGLTGEGLARYELGRH